MTVSQKIRFCTRNLLVNSKLGSSNIAVEMRSPAPVSSLVSRYQTRSVNRLLRPNIVRLVIKNERIRIGPIHLDAARNPIAQLTDIHQTAG